jgi:hypothetical protein
MNISQRLVIVCWLGALGLMFTVVPYGRVGTNGVRYPYVRYEIIGHANVPMREDWVIAWPLVGVQCAIATAIAWWSLRRCRDRRAGYCTRCGYDLRGSISGGSRTCPECGTPIAATQAGVPDTAAARARTELVASAVCAVSSTVWVWVAFHYLAGYSCVRGPETTAAAAVHCATAAAGLGLAWKSRRALRHTGTRREQWAATIAAAWNAVLLVVLGAVLAGWGL